MAFRSIVLLVFLFVSSSAFAETIKVTTWNLKWFPGGMGQTSEDAKASHIDAVAKVLKKIDPDILLLQEVLNKDSVEKLAAKAGTGLKVITVSRFDASHPRDPDGIDDQQVAILAKENALFTYRREFERDGRVDPPRGLVFAAFEIDDKYLGVYSVHLKSNKTSENQTPKDNFRKRESSARTIIDHAEGAYLQNPADRRKKLSFDKLIIAGDFNTEIPGDKPERAAERTMQQIQLYGFENAFGSRPLADRITHPASGRYSATTFDHVLFRGVRQIGEAKIDKVDKSVSDHYPVTVKFDIN